MTPRSMILAAATALVAACGQSASNDASDTAGTESAGPATQAAGPMMQAHMQMQQAMAGVQGENAAETWVRKMIEHHRGAITMSEAFIAQGGDSAIIEKARTTAEDQRRDMQELERLLSAGVSGSGAATAFADAERTMNDQMMAAQGASPSETWLRMMIAHHRGGAQMAEIVIAQGGNTEVTALARRSTEKQNREIAELERLLAA